MARVRRGGRREPEPLKKPPLAQPADVVKIARSARESAAPSSSERRPAQPGDLPRLLTDGLRPRQVRFALALAEGATHVDAARVAGYSSTSHSHRLARSERIREIVRYRQRELAAATGVTAEAVVLRLWKLLNGRRVSDTAKVRAAAILLQHLGSAHRVAPAAVAAAERADQPGLEEADVVAFSRALGIPLEEVAA